jgi:PilZ domain-containing protein
MTFEAQARQLVQQLLETATDRLVSDLTLAARHDADAAAGRARQDAEQAAETQLAAARAEGEARLAAAQAMNAGLLESVESARHEAAAARSQAEADVSSAKQDAEVEIERAQRAARADVERIREEVERAREELEGEVERLHQERTKILLARDEASRRFEAETRRTTDLTARLDASTRDRDAVFDRIAEALRAMDRATTPAEILDTLLEPLGTDFARAAVFMVAPSSLKGWRARGLDPTIDITKLVIARDSESLLARAAVERTRLIAAADGTPVIGLSGNPVPRAVALPVLAGDQVIAVAYAEDVDDAPAGGGVAFPHLGCKIAQMLIDHAALRLTTRTASAPQGQPPTTGNRSEGSSGEGDRATRHAGGENYRGVRQGKRIKARGAIELTVDGAVSRLIDMSDGGAQFVSPQALRPNRILRMSLRAGDSSLACKGRVMWARFEQPNGTSAAHYRVGVKFTEVDTETVATFLAGSQIVAAAS